MSSDSSNIEAAYYDCVFQWNDVFDEIKKAFDAGRNQCSTTFEDKSYKWDLTLDVRKKFISLTITFLNDISNEIQVDFKLCHRNGTCCFEKTGTVFEQRFSCGDFLKNKEVWSNGRVVPNFAGSFIQGRWREIFRNVTPNVSSNRMSLVFFDHFSAHIWKNCTSFMEAYEPDVTLELADASIKVHECILCAHSPLFVKMFESDTRVNRIKIVKMGPFTKDTVQHLLDFLYYGYLKGKVSKMCELYEVAHLYQFYALKKYTMKMIKRSIAEDTVFDLYDDARLYRQVPIMDACLKFMEKNMSRKSVFETIRFALTNNEKKLESIAINYVILELVPEIFESQEWKEFSDQNPKVAIRIFQDYVVDYVKVGYYYPPHSC